MYVCICGAATHTDIEKLVEQNPGLSVRDFQQFGICDNCQTCEPYIESIILNSATKSYKQDITGIE